MQNYQCQRKSDNSYRDIDNCLLLYIAVVLGIVIGQLHADKCDCHAICS